MQKRMVFVAAVVAALAVWFHGSASSAGSRGPTKFKLKQNFAWASFVGKKDCVVTQAVVSAADEATRVGSVDPTAKSYAWVSIFSYDDCSFVILTDLWGYVEITPGEFAMDMNRGVGSLDTSILAHDFVSGTDRTVKVGLSWSDAGSRNKTTDRNKTLGEGFRFSAYFKGAWREAVASGTASDGVTEYGGTAVPGTRNGALSNVTSGTMNFIK